MPGHQAAFAEELAGVNHTDDALFAAIGYDRHFDPALLKIKHCVGRIPLDKNSLPVAELLDGFPILELSEERIRSGGIGTIPCHKPAPPLLISRPSNNVNI